jgi:hypothetical protein
MSFLARSSNHFLPLSDTFLPSLINPVQVFKE